MKHMLPSHSISTLSVDSALGKLKTMMSLNLFVPIFFMSIVINCNIIVVVTAFHNKWNGRLTRHPNIWTIIRSMKDEERRSVRQGRHADRGEIADLPRRKWRLLDRRIRRLKLQYRLGTRSLDSYWDAVAHVVHGH